MDFDLNFCQSITKKHLNQLTELTWIDGIYNLILSGPPGVGKTHQAIALAYHACEEGYKVSYTTMQSLMQVLRTQEIDRRRKSKMSRIQMTGKSYRLENRKSFLQKGAETNEIS